MNIEEKLKAAILLALPENLSKKVRLEDILLEKPKLKNFGDFSTNLAMLKQHLVSEDFANPRELAESIVEQFNQENSDIEASVAGPGFINFRLNDRRFWQIFAGLATKEDELFPQNTQSQKVIVEYSSPNIAKPFSIGHLRSTIIGDAVANLYQAMGYQVFRDNHLGDWGTQFGKQIVAIKKWGDEEAIAKSDNPVAELVKLYVKFHQEAEQDEQLNDEARLWFKKLEQGNSEARRLWQKCIDWSLTEFSKIYQRLGVKFSENDGRGFGESFFEAMLSDLIKQLMKEDFVKEGEGGAKLIFYENDQYPPLMIQKADGATLYATRDLAADKWRLEQERYQGKNGEHPIIINEVGSEQSLYFQQLYRAEELLGWYQKNERIHLKHGLYRFVDGKMSTRKGQVIWLNEVLDKAQAKAQDLSGDEETAKVLSIAALKWNDLKRNSQLSVKFDWDEILNLQGNSGPYMLYAYARAKSILRKAKEQGIKVQQTSDTQQLSDAQQLTDAHLLVEPLEKEIIQLLANFQKIVKQSQQELNPALLCKHLYSLAKEFNSFYNKYQILQDSSGEEALLRRDFRLQLVAQVSFIIKIGLKILGIETLERL
ncbi:MAG: arginine--tRNA ligase [Candidatus Pacebacteria bacterium]|jgi:arginyl-tRNA synthetase|nr:arginine--tRNA ligase [Candidatus Paceibacterota bacterium]